MAYRRRASISRFASLDDLIGQAKAVPPLRRSTRTDTTIKTSSSSTTSSIANSHDAQKRLVRDIGTGSTGVQYTTTYTTWDAKGRPTADTTVHSGGKNNLTIAYDDASRTQTTTSASQSQAVNCTATFDANGNTIATSCLVTLSGSKTTIAATETVCR